MKTYFQFPLCALAFGKTNKERLNAIIAYGLVETGTAFWRKYSKQKRKDILGGWAVQGCKKPNDSQVAVWCGAEVIGVSNYSVEWMVKEHARLKQFQHDFVARHGKDASVRMKKGFVFEARDGKGIIPIELAVLAAIYSIIGDKQRPVRITRERIRQRALGYKSKAVYDLEFPNRIDGAQPLTEWKLRDTVDRLHARKFFRRSTYGRRQTFYTHRMTEAAFREALMTMKTHRSLFRMEQGRADIELTDAIRNLRAATQGKPPPAPDARPVVWRSPEEVF